MNIECPKCSNNFDLDCDDLPSAACDKNEVECTNPNCEHSFMAGWYATTEVRDACL
jgi:predicted Zn finger-like uncharacterized protein